MWNRRRTPTTPPPLAPVESTGAAGVIAPATEAPAAADAGWPALAECAAADAQSVLERLGSSAGGLSPEEAHRRLARCGPNALSGHGARPWGVLWRQLRSPLLLLLVVAALTSLVVGERLDSLIILGIVTLSVGLGFVNEYRSERAVERLQTRIRHRAVAVRGGSLVSVDVTELVPGDVVLLDVGDIVPADVRLLEAHGLECDEAVLTGESLPAAKTTAAVAPDSPLHLASCAFMGTVVQAGTGRAVVVRTGLGTAFGRIASDLGRGAVETGFQLGLREFSGLLAKITVALAVSIFAINFLLGRSLIESALFSLAIAVGLTPQLLPAIVTVSLSYGADRLARRSVLVKRLVSIEDLGNVEILFTDKTGTLTEGRLSLVGALDAEGRPSEASLRLGLLCNSAAVEAGAVAGGNPLDRAIWEAPAARTVSTAGVRRLGEAPFDYDRRLMSVLLEKPDGSRLLVSKGAPEAVLERCADVPQRARTVLEEQFAAGARVVALGTRPAPGLDAIAPADERDLDLAGFLVFSDPLKTDVRDSLALLDRLDVEVKIVTGDNDRVASRACGDIGLAVRGVLTGAELEAIDDEELGRRLPRTTVFARVTPEQKSRVIRVQRRLGKDVAFLGDGVNDAVALHEADVGISVDSASDVAKEAADVVLLEKDLGILAEGVVQGRRIFANTIKYVLMSTSSNFGNMFSAAGASLIFDFLPMTPTQILLNNFLYDVSELAIPTDRVDEEMLSRPAHWDLGLIQRFMIVFGPVSSLFDFLTFGVMTWLFHAREALFQTGWFVESLSTQTLIIFVIRTRRSPFMRSRPGRLLALTSLACVVVGAALPYSPLAPFLGFRALPPLFFGVLAAMVAAYLALVEGTKALFFRAYRAKPPRARRPLAVELSERQRLVRRWVGRWSHRFGPRLPQRTGVRRA
jgi:P-type Mg2+ transporter